jgi:hypothetical protein
MRTSPRPTVTAQRIQRQPKIGSGLRAISSRLVMTLAYERAGLIPERLIQHAVSDAEALAATTPVAELVLPVLAEERVAEMQTWFARQQAIIERSALSFAA